MLFSVLSMKMVMDSTLFVQPKDVLKKFGKAEARVEGAKNIGL